MKKFLIAVMIALFAGYVWGNFGNVSDVSAEFMPNKHDYHSRSYGHGDSEEEYETRGMDYRGRNSSYDYRGREGGNSYDYRGRDSDSSYDYQGRGSSEMEYRGRSARTGRYTRR